MLFYLLLLLLTLVLQVLQALLAIAARKEDRGLQVLQDLKVSLEILEKTVDLATPVRVLLALQVIMAPQVMKVLQDHPVRQGLKALRENLVYPD